MTSYAQKIRLDTVNIGMTAPDDAERLEEVAIDMQRRRQRLSKFGDRRRRNIGDARGRTFEPRMSQDFRHLKTDVSVKTYTSDRR